ncbi:MAG TPA: flagellar export protein FliJ [Stellaceae bacterium]|jgi:flagellar export protein FliJ|nr:flagellar export protein FliJ [Stellaceae bacterium]
MNSDMKVLINLAGHRSDDAIATWQNLQQQCQQALAKLALLKEHRERYEDLLRGGLQRGMSAIATRAYLNFTRQIDDIVHRQQDEVERIEAAVARQWEHVVELRREKRVYEILGERAAAQELETALRRSQSEIDDLLQRAASLPRLR